MAVYGGFKGTETARDRRNPVASVTILSGDIDSNDSQTPIVTNIATVTGNVTNSYHVVTGASGATLDGFTVTAGFAGGAFPNERGGGMYNLVNSPTLANLTFSGNGASASGGGMYNSGSSPSLTGGTFNVCSADYGGGMYNLTSSPTLTGVTFSDNSALNGGGMYNATGSNPTLMNVNFIGNMANGSGGGMSNDSSSPTLTNVTFSGNAATSHGGGIWNYNNSNPQIRNTIFWGNTANNAGAQIFNLSGAASVSDSIVQGGYSGGVNIISTDPKLGMLGAYGGFTQTIPLLTGSSAIDAGNNAVCPPTDQRGVSRLLNAHCDIGAFEVGTYSIYLPLVIR